MSDFIKVYDIVDGWYHQHTRHHLIDIDPNVKEMVEAVVTVVKDARDDELFKAFTEVVGDPLVSSRSNFVKKFNFYLRLRHKQIKERS